ncbi:hypothetical protein DY218_22360 [Streptomyces triticagri]|uniref:Secreted protein n=1 Tax=Streptomyces triticagri TaxID=2293568 RepID=A0A372M2A8_9ACTN|nr:hypothetical protein [Streptomyces triticagri]RFU84407.1 hypothetical protein DY218_22360 [Streptomyces triticagri]
MNSAVKRVVCVSAALLLSVAGLASAATAVDAPDPTSTTAGTVPGAAAEDAAPQPTLSAEASVESVEAWEEFRVQGASTHLPAGTRVTLQQLQNEKWVGLPIHVNTTDAHTYSVRVKLGVKGLGHIRMVGGGAVSNTVQITVR